MRTLSASTALAAAALCLSAAAIPMSSAAAPAPSGDQWHYEVFSGTDAPYEDIKNGMTKDIPTLEQMCTALPACKGFNTNGWLKNDTDPSVRKPEACDLYVKVPGPPPPPQPYLWPLPSTYTNGTTMLAVSPSLKFTGPTSATLSAAFDRYMGIIFPHAPMTDDTVPAPPAPSVSLAGLDVTVSSPSEAPPQVDTDESYTLTIPADGSNAKLSAVTIYGALRGLETFSQLVVYNFDTTSYYIGLAPWSISDKPRFQHRGMLLDSARHFEPIPVLKGVVDAASYAKLNVIHWHIVDEQSFPFMSTTYPKLSEGAWSPQQRFTHADVKELVEYARMRGIRVIVEFDVPGHAASWCTGYPDVCPSASCLMPLNVANNATFTLIDSVLSEVTGRQQYKGLFPDDFVHLGGDEVNTDCWTSTPSVAAWLKKMNFTGDQGYAYFVNRAAGIAFAQERQVIQWVEVWEHFGKNLDNRTVVHVWKAKSDLNGVLEDGYRALLSDSDLWYLDHLDITWDQMYTNEPFADITDPKQQALLLGGEVEMWGETVDPSDIQQTIWPRAAAVSERLWSPRSVNDVTQAHARLAYFRCLLDQRGIAAAPLNNPVGRSAPPGPGSCYTQ